MKSIEVVLTRTSLIMGREKKAGSVILFTEKEKDIYKSDVNDLAIHHISFIDFFIQKGLFCPTEV